MGILMAGPGLLLRVYLALMAVLCLLVSCASLAIAFGSSILWVFIPVLACIGSSLMAAQLIYYSFLGVVIPVPTGFLDVRSDSVVITMEDIYNSAVHIPKSNVKYISQLARPSISSALSMSSKTIDIKISLKSPQTVGRARFRWTTWRLLTLGASMVEPFPVWFKVDSIGLCKINNEQAPQETGD